MRFKFPHPNVGPDTHQPDFSYSSSQLVLPMPPKKKDLASGPAATDAKPEKKERSKEIPWSKNPRWHDKLVEVLESNPTLRRNLFSESKDDAKTAGRSRTQHAKSGKPTYHQEIAQAIFGEVDDVIGVDEERIADYKADPKRYGTSVGGQLARYALVHTRGKF